MTLSDEDLAELKAERWPLTKTLRDARARHDVAIGRRPVLTAGPPAVLAQDLIWFATAMPLLVAWGLADDAIQGAQT